MGFDKSSNKPKAKPESIAPSSIEEIEELPEEIFTQSVNLKASE